MQYISVDETAKNGIYPSEAQEITVPRDMCQYQGITLGSPKWH